MFQNFLNIYQPAQSAMTGIIALNNFADIPQFICSAIESASRARLGRVSKLCLQYLNPIIKNRIYNYIPAGINPFVGTQARPNEITYSEDWLRPGYTPPPDAPAPEAPPARGWLTAGARAAPGLPISRRPPRARAAAGRARCDPSTAESDASDGPIMRRAIAAALCVACIAGFRRADGAA